MDAVKLEHVYKSFGEERVLEDITLNLKKGEFVGIVGPNGCGKSTLIKIIYGIYEPDSGVIEVRGKLGYVPQDNMLLPWKTLKENIILPLKLRNAPRETMRKKLNEIADHLDMREHLDKYPSKVSGGTAKKAALARALVKDPDILLLDEPYNELDQASVESLRCVLNELKNDNVSAIIVSHIEYELRRDIDRMYVLSHRPARVIKVIEI